MCRLQSEGNNRICYEIQINLVESIASIFSTYTQLEFREGLPLTIWYVEWLSMMLLLFLDSRGLLFEVSCPLFTHQRMHSWAIFSSSKAHPCHDTQRPWKFLKGSSLLSLMPNLSTLRSKNLWRKIWMATSTILFCFCAHAESCWNFDQINEQALDRWLAILHLQ